MRRVQTSIPACQNRKALSHLYLRNILLPFRSVHADSLIPLELKTRHFQNTPTMAAAPPGGTFFDNKRSFADVPIDESKDNGISTNEFLEASEALTLLFDVLGSAAFKPVKSDMTGNITVSPLNRTVSQGRKSHHTDFSLHLRNSVPATSPPLSTTPPSNPSSARN